MCQTMRGDLWRQTTARKSGRRSRPAGGCGEGETVSVGDIVEEIGGDAFGPLLLVPALFLVTPVSGVPGMPTIGSLIISLIAVQIVLGRDSLWLPGFLTRREMKKDRLDKALSWLRKPAGWIDWSVRNACPSSRSDRGSCCQPRSAR
jgi:hypothetical protein